MRELLRTLGFHLQAYFHLELFLSCNHFFSLLFEDTVFHPCLPESGLKLRRCLSQALKCYRYVTQHLASCYLRVHLKSEFQHDFEWLTSFFFILYFSSISSGCVCVHTYDVCVSIHVSHVSLCRFGGQSVSLRIIPLSSRTDSSSHWFKE